MNDLHEWFQKNDLCPENILYLYRSDRKTVVHRRAPLSIDVLSIAHYRAEYKILMAFASNFIGLFC